MSGIFFRPVVLKDQARRSDEGLCFASGAALPEAIRLAGAVDGHLGIVVTRTGLCLRVETANIATARASLLGQRGPMATIVESELRKVRSPPDRLDRADFADRLAAAKWPVRVRYGFLHKAVQTWVVGSATQPPTTELMVMMGDEALPVCMS